MAFWHQYVLFFSKLATLGLMLIIVVGLIMLMVEKAKAKEKEGRLHIRSLDEHYEEMTDILQETIPSKLGKKKYKKQRKETLKNQEKLREKDETAPRLFVINFNGDLRASAVNALREEVTAILLTATPTDQVLLRLESPGGMVHAYGLAASQLERLKKAGLHFTVAVDKMAASGGYMMACIADRIIAAPFAILGSIGVIAQVPNFHRLLQKKEIDFEQITAGKYKRTLTFFGENTPEARAKMQEEVNDAHELFKDFIAQKRPAVNIAEVATGEHWFGTRAKELNLIDELQTSDDFLLTAKNSFALYEVEYLLKKPIGKKISSMVLNSIDKLIHWRTAGKFIYR